MTIGQKIIRDGDDDHLDVTVSGAKSVKFNISDSVDVTVIRTGDNDWAVTVDARNRIGNTDVEVLRNEDGPF